MCECDQCSDQVPGVTHGHQQQCVTHCHMSHTSYTRHYTRHSVSNVLILDLSRNSSSTVIVTIVTHQLHPTTTDTLTIHWLLRVSKIKQIESSTSPAKERKGIKGFLAKQKLLVKYIRPLTLSIFNPLETFRHL